MMTEQDSWDRFDAQVESKCRRSQQVLAQHDAIDSTIASLELDIALSDLATMGVIDVTQPKRRAV